MKHPIFKFEITALVLACLTSSGIADVNPPAWTGALKTCTGGTQLWSDEDNWTNCVRSVCPPIDGNVQIMASPICDPCDPNGWCFIDTCIGGPFNGEACMNNQDCRCAGGSFLVDYDYDEFTNTFSTIYIEASSTNDITLQKTFGGSTLSLTGAFTLAGKSTKKVILDLQGNGMNPNDMYVFGTVEIKGSGNMTVDGFIRVFGSGANTVLTIKGSGTVSVAQVTEVSANANYTSKLSLEGTRHLDPTSLKVFGGPNVNRKATFLQGVNAFVDTTFGNHFTAVAMRGFSLIQNDRAEHYILGGDLTVDTNGDDTVAEIDLDSAKKFKADNINITAAGTNSATLKPIGGLLQCDGLVTITGVSGAAAELEIQFSGVSTLLTNVTLNTEGFLDLEQNTTLSGELKLLKDSTAGSELQVATGRTLTVGTLFIKGGVKYDPDLSGTAKIVTN